MSARFSSPAVTRAWDEYRSPPRAGTPSHVVAENHEERISFVEGTLRRLRWEVVAAAAAGGAVGKFLPLLWGG